MKRIYVQPQINTKGLIAHYKLDNFVTTGKVFDYSLNGRVGTVNGTSCLPTFPGFAFDGSADYISIADNDVFSPALTAFSVAAWVNMTDATNFIAACKYLTGKREWILYSDGEDKVVGLIFDESANSYIGQFYDSALTGYQGIWKHFIFTYNGGTAATDCALYLDGVDVGTNSSDGDFTSLENTDQPVLIGKADAATFANGKIGEVLMYNRQLPATEAKSIYEITRRKYGV